MQDRISNPALSSIQAARFAAQQPQSFLPPSQRGENNRDRQRFNTPFQPAFKGLQADTFRFSGNNATVLSQPQPSKLLLEWNHFLAMVADGGKVFQASATRLWNRLFTSQLNNEVQR